MRTHEKVCNVAEQAAKSGVGAEQTQDLRELALNCAMLIEPPRVTRTSSEGSDLRVVLMGRTQAGKSTLLEALSYGSGTRRGDGRQRFSRDVCERPVREVPGVVLVDTPGVGAKDGAEDRALAFSQVPEADLVVWVSSPPAIQEQTAQALRMLGLFGKPVVLVLNCGWEISHPLHREDFLRDPQVAFEDVQGSINAINRQLAMAGARPVRTIVLHAEAAFEATEAGPEATVLRGHSRIEALYETLREERDERRPQRQVLRVIDQVREPTVEYRAALGHAQATLAGEIKTASGVITDLDQRLHRELDRHADLLRAALHRLIERRRTWHTTVDVGQDLNKAWAAEVATLQQDVDRAIASSQKSIAKALKEAAAQVLSDWESLPPLEADLGQFTTFDSVWLNRAGRAAVDLGSGWAPYAAAGALGAEIGLALGIEGGPLLMAITAAAGAVIGFATNLVHRNLRRAIDRLFRSKAEVTRRRREELRTKIHPRLDSIQASLDVWQTTNTRRQHRSVNALIQAMNDALSSQQRVRTRWRSLGRRLERNLREIDAATASALLVLAGYPKVAAQVQRAARAPGVAIAVEFTPKAVRQSARIGQTETCEALLACGPAQPNASASQAVPLMAALSPEGFDVEYLSSRRARILLRTRDVPSGITETWADLLSAFTGSRIEIVRPDPTPPPTQEEHHE